jgi:hypothetical protein
MSEARSGTERVESAAIMDLAEGGCSRVDNGRFSLASPVALDLTGYQGAGRSGGVGVVAEELWLR